MRMDADDGTVEPEGPAHDPIRNANLAMDQESFWQHLQTASHPSDRPLSIEWRAYYWRLVEVTRPLRPHRICEIGVRAGYSALAMLTAAPTAYMLGIEADLDETRENMHCGRKGLYRHALQILREFNYDLLIVNSHAIGRLPRFDLAYIDGEHTFDGCLADLHLVTQTCDTVLVDDVVSIPDVRRACEYFLDEHSEFTASEIDNGLTGLMLLTHRPVDLGLPPPPTRAAARAPTPPMPISSTGDGQV